MVPPLTKENWVALSRIRIIVFTHFPRRSGAGGKAVVGKNERDNRMAGLCASSVDFLTIGRSLGKRSIPGFRAVEPFS